MVNPKYLMVFHHLRGMLFMVRILDLGLRLWLNRTAMVFERFMQNRFFLIHGFANQIYLRSWIMSVFEFLFQVKNIVSSAKGRCLPLTLVIGRC